MAGVKELPDQTTRIAALTELERSLLAKMSVTVRLLEDLKQFKAGEELQVSDDLVVAHWLRTGQAEFVRDSDGRPEWYFHGEILPGDVDAQLTR
jgi:hypothetical protein